MMSSSPRVRTVNTRPLRPVGFNPTEISALYNQRVIEEHATGAAFLWTQRQNAAAAPHFKLKHLARLDERVLAHLYGLRVAGPVGWQAALNSLAQGDPGSVFALAYLAFANGEPTKMRDSLHLALARQSLGDAFEAALSWLEWTEVRTAVGLLLQSAVPDHQRLALGVMVAQKVDPGRTLECMLESDHLPLRARALQVVGLLKRCDLIHEVDRNITQQKPNRQNKTRRTHTEQNNPRKTQNLLDSVQQLPAYQVVGIQ